VNNTEKILKKKQKKDPKFEEYSESLMKLKTLDELIKGLEQVLPQLKQICK
jgi:hypothetical protein